MVKLSGPASSGIYAENEHLLVRGVVAVIHGLFQLGEVLVHVSAPVHQEARLSLRFPASILCLHSGGSWSAAHWLSVLLNTGAKSSQGIGCCNANCWRTSKVAS